jgi:hypothetical protein
VLVVLLVTNLIGNKFSLPSRLDNKHKGDDIYLFSSNGSTWKWEENLVVSPKGKS